MPYPSTTLYPQTSGLYPGTEVTSGGVALTGAATAITTTTATLNGVINPNGVGTTYVFIYGHSGWATATAVEDAGSGSSPVAVDADLTGLTSGYFYQYKLMAFPATGGVIDGGGEYFYTLAGVHDPVFPALVTTAGRGQ